MSGSLVEGLPLSFHLSQFHARDTGRDDCVEHGWEISARIFPHGDAWTSS